MVFYCCVKGCTNNTNTKKKDPSYSVSFHSFPSDPGLKQQWLRAIGRPDWNPPTYTRVCSAHFDEDQISCNSIRVRILDNACPVKALPPNSNFEAANLEVCRFCLATDTKLYSLRNGKINTCISSLRGVNGNISMGGMPQYVCYECSAVLLKCHKLIENSIVAQATLLDIHARHSQLTKTLVREQNRAELNLISPLQSYMKTPVKIYYFNYNSEIKYLENHIEVDNENDTINVHGECEESKMDDNLCKTEDFFTAAEQSDDNFGEEYFSYENTGRGNMLPRCDQKNQDCDNRLTIEQTNVMEVIKVKEKGKRKKEDGLTPDEFSMQEHFNIVILSVDEQLAEWRRSLSRRMQGKHYPHECAVCARKFAHLTSYQRHLTGHSASRGPAECPVCKLRYKSETLARLHGKYTHGKKFHCKICPRVYSGVALAKKHYRWHTGYTYRCTQCAFTSIHEAAQCACAARGDGFVGEAGLRSHRASAHKEGENTELAKIYKCEVCNSNFTSEAANRVHNLTSCCHKKPEFLDPTPLSPSLYKCKCCGNEYQSVAELVRHRSEHAKKKRPSWSLPGDSYPTQCLHCDTTVNNRKEHWNHVRREHPKEKGSYRPVITAVCHYCGKGFQNPTKLRLHELRHSPPALRCAACPRRFHDRARLAAHAHAHSAERAHPCRTCGRAFKMKTHLDRHHRVHSDVASYECSLCLKRFKYSTSLNHHVRSVHYKIPPPPRKRRLKNNGDTVPGT